MLSSVVQESWEEKTTPGGQGLEGSPRGVSWALSGLSTCCVWDHCYEVTAANIYGNAHVSFQGAQATQSSGALSD